MWVCDACNITLLVWAAQQVDIGSANSVSLGRDYLFVQPMADGRRAPETCLKTVTVKMTEYQTECYLQENTELFLRTNCNFLSIFAMLNIFEQLW